MKKDESVPAELAWDAGPAVPKGRRRTAARERWLDTHPQTRVKLAAYAAYLPFWLRKLAVRPNGSELYVLDLFAGPGQYPSIEGHAPGSPLIACHAARMVTSEQEKRRLPVAIHLRFAEPDSPTRALLEDVVGTEGDDLDVEVLKGRASEELPRLIAESGSRPTLTLLDPDGVKPLLFDMVASLARPQNEVLLSFDVTAIHRLANGHPGAVTAWFGGDGWRRFQHGSTFDDEGLLEAYREQLRPLFNHTTVGRLVFPRVRANRAIVQATQHELGVELWSDAFEIAADQHGGQLRGLRARRLRP